MTRMAHPSKTRSSAARKLWYLAQVQVEQWLPTHVTRALTRRRLTALLEYCWRFNPMYRALWDAHIGDERDFSQADILSRLPIVTKADFRRHGHQGSVSEDYALGSLKRTRSSGSSGVGLEMFFSHAELDHVSVRQYRGMTMAGCRPWHLVAYSRMSPVPFEMSQGRDGVRSVMGLFRSLFLPYDLEPQEVVDGLIRSGADFYSCYPSYARRVLADADPDSLRRLQLRGVVLNSEKSTPAERAWFAEAFGCPVYDIYGAEECWGMAALCSHGRYHLSTDAVVFEVVDADGNPVEPGQRGTLLITSLRGRAMPFVRYQLGDEVVISPEPCTCGRSTSVLESIDGRILDYLVLPSGRRVHGQDARIFLECDDRWKTLVFEALMEVQMVQRSRDVVELLYVAPTPHEDPVMTEFASSFSEYLDHEVRVEWKRVDALTHTANGKVPMVLVDLPSNDVAVSTSATPVAIG